MDIDINVNCHIYEWKLQFSIYCCRMSKIIIKCCFDRFVTYNAVLTHHALTAVKVLCLVVRSSTVPLPLLTGNEVNAVTSVLHISFVLLIVLQKFGNYLTVIDMKWS